MMRPDKASCCCPSDAARGCLRYTCTGSGHALSVGCPHLIESTGHMKRMQAPSHRIRFAVPAGEDFGAHPKELSQLRSGQPKHGPQCKFLPRQHAQVAYEEGSFILGALRLRCECVHPCAATLLTSQGEGSVALGSRGQQVGLPSEASTSVQPAGGDAGCRTLQGAAAPQLACRHLLYGSGTHI